MNFAPLKTRRLDLRPFEKNDLESLRQLTQDRQTGNATAETFFPADAAELPIWLKGRRADMVAGVGLAFGCWRRADHALLGVASLSLTKEKGDITFWFLADIFGQGFEAEAIFRLVELAFHSLYITRICAVTDVASVQITSILKESGLKLSCGTSTTDPAIVQHRGARLFEVKSSDARHQHKPLRPSVMFVGAVALVDRFNRVLVGQRPVEKAMPNLWEFPGGKLKPGEMLSDSAIRETAEELGVSIAPGDLIPFSVASHCYSDFHLVMLLFLCRQWSGECRAIHHQAIEWVPPTELVGLSVPPADVPLMRELRGLLMA